ncbi:hypothetical protein GCM10023205_04730 [Yinghuangia aomiensis]|uniref:Phosphotransferase enzyme family protein n=1 Tax=Yinghuangia aomiensis TaxID=676205 RepID=A0ABP9GU11_9ACTN
MRPARLETFLAQLMEAAAPPAVTDVRNFGDSNVMYSAYGLVLTTTSGGTAYTQITAQQRPGDDYNTPEDPTEADTALDPVPVPDLGNDGGVDTTQLLAWLRALVISSGSKEVIGTEAFTGSIPGFKVMFHGGAVAYTNLLYALPAGQNPRPARSSGPQPASEPREESPPVSAPRRRWTDLDPDTRAAVEQRLGSPVVHTRSHDGGYTTGLASTARLADDRTVFLKGIPAEHELADMYRTEAVVNAALPAHTSVPRLWWADDTSTWHIQAYTAVDGRHPDLAPGSPDLPAVVDLLAHLAPALTLCPLPGARTMVDDFADLFTRWHRLADNPPADLHPWYLDKIDAFTAAETAAIDTGDGDTLAHLDIRADNILIDKTGRAWLVDWAWAVRGAAWADPATLIAQLIIAGHTPSAAEQLVSSVPAYAAAPPDAVTGLAIGLTGYWEAEARAPTGPELRAYRERAAHADRAWLRHRLAV